MWQVIKKYYASTTQVQQKYNKSTVKVLQPVRGPRSKIQIARSRVTWQVIKRYYISTTKVIQHYYKRSRAQGQGPDHKIKGHVTSDQKVQQQYYEVIQKYYKSTTTVLQKYYKRSRMQGQAPTHKLKGSCDKWSINKYYSIARKVLQK